MLPHDFDFTTVIPQAKTFSWITRLHRDWLKDSSSVNIVATTRWTKKQGESSEVGGIKALIVSIVCQWPEFANEYMKLYSQQNGYDKDDFKKIIAYAVQHCSDFESLRQKYCMPINSQSTTASTSSGISIKYPKNTNSNFYRLTIYDPKYQPAARRHIYLGKKVGNTYKVSVGGSTVTSWYNEPFFDSVAQAEAFINKVGNINTTTNPITFEYTITDKPVISGSHYNISDLTNCVLVNTDCGPAYIHKRNEKCVEALEVVELEEDIEKHDNLNPVIFDGDKLRPEVREQSLLIIEEFLKMLEDLDISIDVKDIVLTGSNASYNYTKDSDIDIHIIADTSKYKDTNKLYPIIYDAYKSLFNKKFEIKFYNIPIEIYVENQDTPVVSNGIYSIKDNKWLKEPELLDIPEIDLDKVNEAVKPWKDEALDLIKKAQSGELKDELPIDEYISRLYELRHKGFKSEGEFSIENLVFKEIRNNGYLDKLKDLKNELIAARLSLKENLNLNEAKIDHDNFKTKFGDDIYDLFLKSTQRLKNANISTDMIYHTKNTSVKDLTNILYNLRSKVKSSNTTNTNLTKIQGKYTYLGSSKGYDVYKILDVEASMSLGVGTGWCISGRYGHSDEVNFKPSKTEASKHWEDYTSKGIQFFFFTKNGLGEYALALYPKFLKVDKIIDNNYFIEKTNFELYNKEDVPDYKAASFLPLDLIKEELIIEKQELRNGLAISKNGKTLIKADKEIVNAIIPEGITSICSGAFVACSSLISITIPDSVTSIGNGAFYNCTSLTSVTIGNGVTSIGEDAFYNCESLTSINIPNSVTKIGFSAFSGCSSLTSIVIPNSVTSIDNWAFYGCKSLTSITVPNSVTSIGRRAFTGCSSLTSINIPDSVILIGDWAFENCTSLKSITIPNSVTSIDSGAFYNCTSLTIYCEAKEQPSGWSRHWNYSNRPVYWAKEISKE